jgi:hypothetical protein
MTAIRAFMRRGWLAVLCLGPIAVLTTAGFTFWSAKRAVFYSDDEDLRIAAERVAAAADLYVARIVNDLTMLVTSPAVLDAGGASSALPRDLPTEKILNAHWESASSGAPELDASINALLNTPVSAHFQRIVGTNGTIIREIALADKHGRLVAASVRTDDYLQDDDSWWPVDARGLQACAGTPVSCAQFGDIRWDDTANAFGLDVVLPVVADEQLVGVLKAVVDPVELADIARISDRFTEVVLRKRNGEMLLVRDSLRYFSDEEFKAFVDPLRPGAETVVRRANGNVAVRALAGPMGDYWIVAARSNREPPGSDSWLMPALWLALTAVAIWFTAFAAWLVGKSTANARAQTVVGRGLQEAM